MVDIKPICLNKRYLFQNKINYLDKIYFCFAKIKLSRHTFKKETLAQVFSCEFWKISKNTFSYRKPPLAASYVKFPYIKNLCDYLHIIIISKSIFATGTSHWATVFSVNSISWIILSKNTPGSIRCPYFARLIILPILKKCKELKKSYLLTVSMVMSFKVLKYFTCDKIIVY